MVLQVGSWDDWYRAAFEDASKWDVDDVIFVVVVVVEGARAANVELHLQFKTDGSECDGWKTLQVSVRTDRGLLGIKVWNDGNFEWNWVWVLELDEAWAFNLD